MKLSQAKRRGEDVFLYRAYLAQRKFGVVLMRSSPPAWDQAVRMFADSLCLKSRRGQHRGRAGLDEQERGRDQHSPALAALYNFHHDQKEHPDAALRALHQGDSLECSAMTVQILR